MAVLLSMSLSGTASGARAEAPRVDRVAVLIARGQARASAGDEISALSYFRDAVGSAPRDPRGYRALAEGYVRGGEPNRAVEVYQAAIVACGELPDLLLGLARAEEYAGRPDVALLVLRTLTARDPAMVAALEARARISLELGRFAEALDAQRALLAVLLTRPDEDPREARLHVRALSLLLGDADRVSGDDQCTKEASALRRTLARCPDPAERVDARGKDARP